jgi:hypothetical protein
MEIADYHPFFLPSITYSTNYLRFNRRVDHEGIHHVYLGHRTDVYGMVGLVSCIAGIGMAWLLQDVLHDFFLSSCCCVCEGSCGSKARVLRGFNIKNVSSRTLRDRRVVSMDDIVPPHR